MNIHTEKLFYKSPAQHWEEALPLGNGRLGGMVSGGYNVEKLSLNEDTLWSGPPGEEIYNEDYGAVLFSARKLVSDKCFAEATDFLRNSLSPCRTAGYLPAQTVVSSTYEYQNNQFETGGI